MRKKTPNTKSQKLSDTKASTVVYTGFLETYNRYKVAGWAFADDVNVIPNLDVYVNNVHIGTFSPDAPRQDLGRDKAGFCFTFPKDLFKEKEKVAAIDIRFCKTGKSIQNSPVTSSIAIDDKEKVLIGKDEVLFLVNDSNDVVSQVSGYLKMPIAAQQSWKSVLADRAKHAAERKMSLVHLVIPDKERVYADKLPDHIKISDHTMFQQWSQLLHPSAPVFYPLDEFIKGRKIRDTYSKGDTHWNEYGAYLCYKKLCEILSLLFSEEFKPIHLADDMFSTVFYNADLLAKLGGVCIEPQIKIVLQAFSCQVLHNNGLWLTGRQVSFRSTRPEACSKRLLVFHDSFGTFMEHLLASHFSESKFVWSADVLWDEVDSFQPDIILIEQVERFLIKSPKS